MKTKHIIVAILWPFFTTTIVSLFFLPDLFHCFDRQGEVIVAGKSNSFRSGKTSNAIVIGSLREELTICLEKTSIRYRVSDYIYFIPVVRTSFGKTDTVDCLMKLDGKQLNILLKEQKSSPVLKINVIVRDKLWEGFDNSVLDELQKNNIVAKNVLYVEFGAQSSFSVWLGSIVFLLSLIGSYSMIYSAKQLK